MSDASKPSIGAIAWHDLSVADAALLREFYQHVAGWTSSSVQMGGYDDYGMHDVHGAMVAGVCHARGANADLPPQWLMYVVVADVAAAALKCVELGGELVTPVRGLMGGQFCVIRDPAGAVCALWQEPAKS